MKNNSKKQEIRKISSFFQKWTKFLIIFCSVAVLTLSLAEYGYSTDESPPSSECPPLPQSGSIEQELTIEKTNPDLTSPNKWIPVSDGSITIPAKGNVTVKNPSLSQNYSISYACFGTKASSRKAGIQLIQGDLQHLRLVLPSPLLSFPQHLFGELGDIYLVAKPLIIQVSSNEVQYGEDVTLTLSDSDTTQQVNWRMEPPSIGTFNSTDSSAKTIYKAPTKDKANGTTEVTITASKLDNQDLSPIKIKLTNEAQPLTINAISDEVQYGKEIKLTLSYTTQPVNWQANPAIGTLNPTAPSAETTFTAPTEAEAKEAKEVTITASKDGKDLPPIKIQLKQGSSDAELMVFVRKNIYLGNGWTALIAALLLVGFAYTIIALAVFTYHNPDEQKKRNLLGIIKDFLGDNDKFRYLNPLVITSGTFGKASLSRLQLLGFTIIIIGLLVYILILTGNLSDLSNDVLVLLGFSASGTIGTGAVQSINKRLSFENWAWVRNQHWLIVGEQGCSEHPKPKPEEHARWKDLILDDNGTLNVYKFQLALASLLVAVFLIRSGGTNLVGFKMPQGFPELLGISNLFYILGKAFEPPSFTELNTTLNGLRDLDKQLHIEQKENPTLHLEDLTSYKLYIEKAQLAAAMLMALFSDLKGTKFDEGKLPIPDQKLLPYWAENLDAKAVVTPVVLPTIIADIADSNKVKYGQEVKLTLSDNTQQVTWTADPPIGTLNPTVPSFEATYTLTEADAQGVKEVTINALKGGQNLTPVTIQFEP